MCDLRTFIKVTPYQLDDSEVTGIINLKDYEYSFDYYDDSVIYVEEEHISEAKKIFDQAASRSKNQMSAGKRQPSIVGTNPLKNTKRTKKENRKENDDLFATIEEEDEDATWRAEAMISRLHRSEMPLHPHRLRRSTMDKILKRVTSVDSRLPFFKCALKNTMLHFGLISKSARKKNLLQLSDKDQTFGKCSMDG